MKLLETLKQNLIDLYEQTIIQRGLPFWYLHIDVDTFFTTSSQDIMVYIEVSLSRFTIVVLLVKNVTFKKCLKVYYESLCIHKNKTGCEV